MRSSGDSACQGSCLTESSKAETLAVNSKGSGLCWISLPTNSLEATGFG
jgi:hypothetical protein